MSKVIAVANQKGGVGKTTTVLSLTAALTELGYKALMVDADPQGSLTLSCGVNPDLLQTENTLFAVLSAVLQREERPGIADIVVRTQAGDLAPSDIQLSMSDLDFSGESTSVYILNDALERVRGRYDFVVIDTPPSLGILTLNALAAADSVIVPLQVDYLAAKGLDLVLQTIGKVQSRINNFLRVEGVLLTMADMRTAHAREVIEATRQRLSAANIRVFDSVIRDWVRLKEAPATGQSILSYAKGSQGAEAYRQLARELL
ncbi:MAG: ParA family protein [Chloroflexi bacterium]|nr:ParA family protein [Chloroflexota bacterium]